MFDRIEKFLNDWSKLTLIIILFLAYCYGIAWAADTAISGLTADATPGDDSLIVTVDDPGGTPATRKTTLAQLWTWVYGHITTTIGASYDTSAELDALFAAKQNTITFGTGAESALGVNIGSAGAPILFNGALGTPSSGTGTNLTGIPGTGVIPGANQTQTIADSGDGNPAADTITFTANIQVGHKDVTCSDADGCTATMSETSAVDGQKLSIQNVSANALTFADSSGVQEMNGACVLAQHESVDLEYAVDRWIDKGCNSNTIPMKSFASTEVDRIPITAFTDGAAPPEAAAVISSADGAFNCRAFAGITTDENVLFTWKAPADIDTTQGIKFSVSGVVGSATAPANTEVIAFSLAGVSIGNSDAAGSVGTAQTSSLTADATYAQYDSLDTAYSSAITVTNLAAGETVSFELIRLATTTDTYAQDFHPHTILIKYVRLHNATF